MKDNKKENLITRMRVLIDNKGYILSVKNKTPNFIYKNYIEIFNNFKIPEYPGMINGKFFNPPNIEKKYIKEDNKYYNYYILKYYDKNTKNEKFLKAISTSNNLKFKATKEGLIPILVDENGNIIKEYNKEIIKTPIRENVVDKIISEYSEFNENVKNMKIINLSSITIQEAETGIEKTYNFSYKQANRNTIILPNGEIVNVKNINKKLDGTIEVELKDGTKTTIDKLKGNKPNTENKTINQESLNKWIQNHGKITETLELPNGEKIFKFEDGLTMKSNNKGGFDIVKNFEVIILPNGEKAYLSEIPTKFKKLTSINGKTDPEIIKKLRSAFFEDVFSKNEKEKQEQKAKTNQKQEQKNETIQELDYSEIPF